MSKQYVYIRVGVGAGWPWPGITLRARMNPWQVGALRVIQDRHQGAAAPEFDEKRVREVPNPGQGEQI